MELTFHVCVCVFDRTVADTVSFMSVICVLFLFFWYTFNAENIVTARAAAYTARRRSDLKADHGAFG